MSLLQRKRSLGRNTREQEARERLAMLEGDWGDVLTSHMLLTHAEFKVEMVGAQLSQGVNLYRSVVKQTSTLYDRGLSILNEEASSGDIETVESWELFRRHQRHNQYVTSVRESFVALQWDEAAGKISTRLVTADCVEAFATHEDPTTPVEVREKRERVDPGTKQPATYTDVWSIKGGVGSFKVLDAKGEDVTERFAPHDEYPYIDSDGRAFLPWVLYHAEEATTLFSPHDGNELKTASLDLAVRWNDWNTMLRDSAYRIKYIRDLTLGGSLPGGDGEGDVQSVQVSHNGFLNMTSADPAVTGEIGSLDPSVDLKKVAEAIEIATEATIRTLGLTSFTVQVSSPQSGVALTVKRDALRDIQLRSAPLYKRSDSELISKAVSMGNIHSELGITADGWTVEYPSIPLSSQEFGSRWTIYKEMVESKVITESEAKALLGL